MPCNVKQNSIDALVKEGVLDTSMTILIKSEFDKLNTKYSNHARLKYNVKNDGLLFNMETKTVPRLGASVYNREDTKVVLKAVPNNEMFEELQKNHDENNITPMLQVEDMPASRASNETIKKVKEAAEKMGISIQGLSDYAKSAGLDIKSVNGVADLVRGVIAVAEGREDEALTEEMVHIATAILEQTNPQLVTSLISKIGDYNIYKETFEKYKNNKNYQLTNGKPDIRKIKKEAVDKLIAEYIVFQSEGSTEFPELREKVKRNAIQKMWDTIVEAIKSLYGKTNVDIFEDAAKSIITGDIGGVVTDITSGEVFFQLKNEKVDNFYNIVMDKDSKLKLIPGDDRHYENDGVRVAKTVTEKVHENKNMPERVGFDKLQDDQKKEWGSEGHDYIANYITQVLIDKDGYKRPTAAKVKITTKLNDTVREKIEKFAEELINSYAPGTRFIIEKKVVNEKVKGMLASTVDFMAIEPVIKQDGSSDIKVDILDWKFANINKALTDDIPWFKRKDWIAQMGEYSQMMYNYGLKREQLRKTRMVPFVSNYNYAIEGDKKSPLVLNSIEIGDLNNVKETKLYLLPVPLNTESTGNLQIDKLLESLRTQYEKLYKRAVSPEEKFAKNLQLNELDKAIRHLHVKIDFEPLVGVGKTFLNNAAKSFKSFENIDYTKLTKEEIEKNLQDLIEYEKSALKFAQMDEVFLSSFPKQGLSAEDKQTLASLEQIASSTGRMLDRIKALRNDFAVQIALKEGITTEATKMTVLDAEREIDTLSKTFLEGSKLASNIIRLASNMIMNAASLVNIKTSRMINQYGELLKPLEKEARAMGKSAFDLIGTVKNGKMELIKRIDSKFLEQVKEAKKDGNKQFLLDNMNITEYNKLAQEQINKGVEELNNTRFSSDMEQDAVKREMKITQLKDSLDINRPTFNGYEGFQFSYLFNKTMLKEKHYSAEFKQMMKSEAALKMWEFMTALNEKAINMGYLANRGISFFPLMEASLLQKMSNASDVFKESKDLVGDAFTVKVNEEQKYSKIDPETNQIKKQIPTYFTRTDKEIHQLSRDMTKVGPLWIKALLEYESAKSMENTLLTLHSVEKAKGRLLVDEGGNLVREAGIPKTDQSQNKNADILQTIIDDALYNLGENLDSFGNVKLGTAVEKLSQSDEQTTENRKLSIKKGIENSNKLVQSLAVGLSPLISIANYFGYNFQAFINSGRLMTYGEFSKNNAKVTTGIGLTTLDKGLLDLIVPLNEDVAKEKRRQLAKEESYIKWLGTWTFTDVMMVTNSFPEKRLQLATALTMNENSMVVNGKVVNIRQYVAAQDRAERKGKTEAERKAIERSYEDRVAKLKETQSLSKVAKLEESGVVIPGVSDEELAKYRTSIVEYVRNLNGQMNPDNKADYRRDTIFRSFMMFKNWIPKQVSLRTSDIKKNAELNDWEYGRMRVFFKTWAQLGFTNILQMREVLQGTDKGIEIMNKMLEKKRDDYYKKTGQILEITDEEFYDLIRSELSNQMKELALLLGLMATLVGAKIALPPEDEEDELKKNRLKYALKGLHKVVDEMSFYYNPLSTESMTRGSILPALGLLVKAEKIVEHILREGYGQVTDNQEIIDAAHPTKYFFNIIPVGYQFQRDVLPLINPELAKELGIRVSTQSRIQ